MTEEINQAYTVNGDGSISVKMEGKTIKYVLESDLYAVKGALKDKDGELTKLQTALAGTNTKYDGEHQLVLQERAAKELLEKDAREASTLKTKVTELETKMADLTKVSGEATGKLTEQIRSILKTSYKIDEAKLVDKALPELEQIHNALQLTGVMPAPANYDGGGSGGGTGNLAGKSPLALATLGFEQKK